jgi:hypothetical protein
MPRENRIKMCNPDYGHDLGNDKTPSLSLYQSIDYLPLLTRAYIKVHSQTMDQVIIMAPHKIITLQLRSAFKDNSFPGDNSETQTMVFPRVSRATMIRTQHSTSYQNGIAMNYWSKTTFSSFTN